MIEVVAYRERDVDLFGEVSGVLNLSRAIVAQPLQCEGPSVELRFIAFDNERLATQYDMFSD